MKTNRKMYATAIAAVVAASGVVAVAPTSAAGFGDVDPTSPHAADIQYLFDKGYVQGIGNGNYGPALELQRDWAAKIIAQAAGLTVLATDKPTFTDAQTGEFAGYIAALQNAGIVDGYPDGTFNPTGKITRGEMAKMIVKAFNLPTSTLTNDFTDIADSYFAPFINDLAAYGVSTGKTPTTFAPNDVVTREQIASFVVRASKVANYSQVKDNVVSNILSNVTTAVDASVATVTTTTPNEATIEFTNSSVTADEASDLFDTLVESVTGAGTTVALAEATVGSKTFVAGQTTVADILDAIDAFGEALGLSEAQVAAIKAGGTDEVFPAGTNLDGEITLTFKDGTTQIITINIVVPS